MSDTIEGGRRLIDAAARIEENMLTLEARVKIAEHAALADRAEDIDGFLGAIEAELDGWDVYLERLQVTIATRAGERRERAESAIGELRRHRNRFGAGVLEISAATPESWRDIREALQAVREELESRAAEFEATFADGRTG